MSADRIKTKQQLINELRTLRLRVAAFEKEADESDEFATNSDAIAHIQQSAGDSPNPIFWIAPNGSFLFVNDAASETLGYTRDELLSMSVPDIDPERQHDWVQHWDESRSKNNHVLESTHQRKDGSCFPVELTISFVSYLGQECQWVFVRDISEQEREKHELQEALAKAKRSNSESKMLFEMAQTILEGRTLEENAQHTFETAHRLLGAGAGCLIQLESEDQDQQLLFFEAGKDTTRDGSLDDSSASVRQLFENAKYAHDPIFENHFPDGTWIQSRPNERIEIDNLLLAPIETPWQTVGLFGLANKPGGFDAHDAQLATHFTRLIAIGLQHGRMDETITNQLRQRELLAALSQFGLSAPNLQAIFDETVSTIVQIFEVEYAKILELMPGGEQLLLRAGVGWHDGLVGRATVGTESASQAGYTLLSQNPIVVKNMDTEERFQAPPLLTEHSVHSGMSVTIGDTAQPFGVLGVHSRTPRNFTYNEVQFFESVALLLAQSIQAYRTTQRLAESEDRFRSLAESSPVGIFLNDAEGIFIYVNPKCAELIGHTPEECIGQDMAPFLHPDDRIPLRQKWTQTIACASRFQMECRWLHSEGDVVTTLGIATPIFQTDGSVACYVGTLLDITESREQALQQELENACLKELNHPGDLHRSTKKLLALLKEYTGCDGIGIRLREGGDFPYFESLGLPEDFLEAAKSLCTQDTEGIRILDKTGINPLECLCGSVISGKVNTFLAFSTELGSFWTNNRTSDLASAHKTGQPIPLRSTCSRFGYESQALIPLRSLGRTLGMIQFNGHRKGIFTPTRIKFLEDLSTTIAIAVDRKLQENERRRSRSLSKSIALASQQFLLTGNIAQMQKMIVEEAVYLTKAQYGILLGSFTGKGCRILAVSDSVWEHLKGDPALSAKMRAGIADHGFFDLEMGENLLTLALTQGVPILANHPSTHSGWSGNFPPNHIPLESFLGMPVSHGPNIVGMIAVANRKGGFGGMEQEDLSELGSSIAMAMQAILKDEEKQGVEAQLQQSQKMEAIGRLAGGVAHDFNNMLSVISGYTEIAISELIPSDPMKQDLEEIDKAAKRAANLTRHLLAFARQQPIAPEPTDLNRSIDSCKNMLRRMIGEDIQLKFLPDHDLWTTYVDPHQIDQILVNFSVNARDAIEGAGKIIVETNNITIEADYCEYRPFSIPGHYVQLIFSDDGCGIPAEIVEHIFEPFYTTKEAGRGTGLGLATVYGIVKQSNGFITVYSEPGIGTTFKVYLPKFMAEAEGIHATPTPLITRGHETILVAEDEIQILQYIKRILEQFGYTVLTANSPGEACDLCKEHKDEIDLLLTDVVMPSMNGQELREHLETLIPGLKTLFMSGYTADVISQRGILAKGIRFLQKPFDSYTLASRIREILDSGDFD